jgi:thioredoxin 2
MDKLVACPACGATNRLRPEKRGAACGACKTALPAAGGVEVVTDAGWEGFIHTKRLPVLVDFWAPWCGPCRMVGPVVELMAGKYFGLLRVGKLNTDENPGAAARYNIRSIPSLILFRDGQVLDQVVGALPQAQLDAWLGRWVVAN